MFLARDAAARVLCLRHAGIPKDHKAAEILRFADFWQERTGRPPVELVFDSQLTTYEHLHQLNQRGIGFLTFDPHAAHAGPHLEPAGVGLATHHLTLPDPSPSARPASWTNAFRFPVTPAKCGKSP